MNLITFFTYMCLRFGASEDELETAIILIKYVIYQIRQWY